MTECRFGSGGDAVVRLQEYAEPLSAANLTVSLRSGVLIEDVVADVLAAMGSFGKVMPNEFTHGAVHLAQGEDEEMV